MTATSFVENRRVRWRQCELLLERARGGGRLSGDEIEQLGRLYRLATSDLAIARRDFPGDPARRYLEQLVGRAHPVVYQPADRDLGAPLRFFQQDVPRVFRATQRYTLISFVLFAAPFLIAFFTVLRDPLAGRTVLPAGPFVEQVERGESWLEISGETRPLAASFIMTNNIRVAILAFAGGVLLGIGTVFVLLFNGLHIGTVAGLAASNGLGGDLGAFVAAHGGVELTVIFICGGAGLQLGAAVLAPGLVTRGRALSVAARRAVTLLLGCVPWLVLAGTIEGFISPSGLPWMAKLAVGAGSTALFFVYLYRGGRGEPESRRERRSRDGARAVPAA